MNSNEKVIFDRSEIYDGLEAFVIEVLNDPLSNPYIDKDEDQLKATRKELKQALIAHLTKVIDDDIEHWVEQPLEARTVVMENKNATD